MRRWATRILDRLIGREHLRQLAALLEKLDASSRQARLKWEQERAALKRASAARHRRVLSPRIMEAVLPLRARTIPARSREAQAQAYDARLQELSAAYRDAVAAIDTPLDELAQTTIHGLPWCVPVADLNAAAGARVVEKQRFPFRNITQTRELAVGPVMVDIGANTGRMSIPRILLGDFQRAYCAEPDPLNYAALVRNVAANGMRGLILPDQVAIGSSCGTARLHRAKYSGGHRLVAAAQDHAINVPCVTLNEWCRRLGIDLDLVSYVKVDTQGWELEVLRGASELLARRHIGWQLEISPALLRHAGTSPQEVCDLCGRHFTHFIDLAKRAAGPRARPIAELGSTFAYLEPDGQTDVLLFTSTRELRDE